MEWRRKGPKGPILQRSDDLSLGILSDWTRTALPLAATCAAAPARSGIGPGKIFHRGGGTLTHRPGGLP